MVNAFIWGLLATSSLIIGGNYCDSFYPEQSFHWNNNGIGAGTLISAISYELIFEAVKMGRSTGFPAFGFFSGAATFFFLGHIDWKFRGKEPFKSWSSQEFEFGNSQWYWPLFLMECLNPLF